MCERNQPVPLPTIVGGEPGTDALAIAARDDLDGVVVASPEDTHEALVMAAFTNGTRSCARSRCRSASTPAGGSSTPRSQPADGCCNSA
jgi:hypothetical protein